MNQNNQMIQAYMGSISELGTVLGQQNAIGSILAGEPCRSVMQKRKLTVLNIMENDLKDWLEDWDK